jgi:predicted enzyme related to lactoylglutathione lyase
MTIRTITVPVKDLEAATAIYTALLGTEPYVTSAYYVGFRPEGAPELGLDPHGDVAAGPIAYHLVDDIEAAIAALTEKGASVERSPHDVGGPLIATMRDNDGNLIGLYQGPAA